MASTYRWQLPTPVSITGTWLLRTTASIRPAPPRGISTSTRPRAAISSAVTSRGPGTSWTASAGRSASTSPACSASTIAALESAAEDEPRSSAALPDFRQMPAGVGRHVRARLVDDADHAERHPHLPDLHPVGVGPAADHVADRIGQRGEIAQTLQPCRRSGPGSAAAGRSGRCWCRWPRPGRRRRRWPPAPRSRPWPARRPWPAAPASLAARVARPAQRRRARPAALVPQLSRRPNLVRDERVPAWCELREQLDQLGDGGSAPSFSSSQRLVSSSRPGSPPE